MTSKSEISYIDKSSRVSSRRLGGKRHHQRVRRRSKTLNIIKTGKRLNTTNVKSKQSYIINMSTFYR